MEDVIEKAGFVSCDEAQEIAARYNRSHFGERTPGERARYTIPADTQRDDDIRLDAFIARARKMEIDLELLAKLRAHPGFSDVLSTAEDMAVNFQQLADEGTDDDLEGFGVSDLAAFAGKADSYKLLLQLLRGQP